MARGCADQVGTTADINNLMQASTLVHGKKEQCVCGYGLTGCGLTQETQGIKANWHVTILQGRRKVLDKATQMGRIRAKG